MKTLFTATLAFIALSSFAFAAELDGKTFCRTIKRDRPSFGQPAGTRTHCVSFARGRATDNAPTFFGNPPETFAYSVYGLKIINVKRDQETGYEIIDARRIIIRETGAVLTLARR